MKAITKLSFIIFFVFSAVSCDQLKELATLKIDNVKISQEVPISVSMPAKVNGMKSPSVGDITFTKSADVQLSSVPELQNYLTLIKTVNIDSITCTVKDAENGVVKSLAVKVSPLDYTKSVTNIEVGKPINVTFTRSELDLVAGALLSNEKLTFMLEGVVTKAPVDFKLEVTIYSNFVVKLLE